MLLGETVRVALASLRANKMRSFLTMLGIVIGIASVIAMVALGKGAEQSVKERIARLGTSVLQINPQRLQQGGVGTTNAAKLTMKDVDMIRERARNVLGAGVLPLLDVTDARALIGEPVRIAGRQFTVIGVLAEKGMTGFGDNDEQVLGAGASTAFREWLGWQTTLGTSGIVVALVFSVAVGLTFGVWPARRASALDPIEALRYE